MSLLIFVYLARTSGAQTAYVSGSEAALVGQRGVAISDLAPSGVVAIAKKEWTATAELGNLIRKGEEVMVIAVYSDILKVIKHSKQAKRKSRRWLSVFRRIGR